MASVYGRVAGHSAAIKTEGSSQRPPRVVSATEFTSVVRIAPPTEQQACVSRSAGSWTSVQFRDDVSKEDGQLGALLPGTLYDQSVEYDVDGVFDCHVDQASFYKSAVRPVVEQTLQGYRGSVIALGPKGTGKKYAMRGPADSKSERPHHGAIVRSAEHIFHCLRLSNSSAKGLVVIVSYLAVYREVIHDLLGNKAAGSDSQQPGQEPASLSGKSLKTDGGVCIVEIDEDGQLPGLSEHVVSCAEEVEGLLYCGIQEESKLFCNNATVGSTSDSSHVVFTITVEHRAMGSDFAPVSGLLRLVEVADWTQTGYNAAISSSSKNASATIDQDKSLVAFLRTLTKAQLEQPVNGAQSCDNGAQPKPACLDSDQEGPQLMRLLSDCVGGNSKTVLVWNVSPNAKDSHVSKQVLAAAANCKGIRNHPDKRELAEQALMNAYIRALRQKHRNLVVARSSRANKQQTPGAVSSHADKVVRDPTQAGRLPRLQIRHADKVVWDPTQAGLLPRFQINAGMGESSRRNFPGADSETSSGLYDDISHDAASQESRGRDGVSDSDDEYNFEDVTPAAWPEATAEPVSTEEAAGALAAAATADYEDDEDDVLPIPKEPEAVSKPASTNSTDSKSMTAEDATNQSTDPEAAAIATVDHNIPTGPGESQRLDTIPDPSEGSSSEPSLTDMKDLSGEESVMLAQGGLGTTRPKDSLECLETSKSSLCSPPPVAEGVCGDPTAKMSDIPSPDDPIIAQPKRRLSLLQRLRSAKRPAGSAKSSRSQESSKSIATVASAQPSENRRMSAVSPGSDTASHALPNEPVPGVEDETGRRSNLCTATGQANATDDRKTLLHIDDVIAMLSGDERYSTKEALLEMLQLLQQVVRVAGELPEDSVDEPEVSGAELISLMWEEAVQGLASRDQAVRIANHLLSVGLLTETGGDVVEPMFKDREDVSYRLVVSLEAAAEAEELLHAMHAEAAADNDEMADLFEQQQKQQQKEQQQKEQQGELRPASHAQASFGDGEDGAYAEQHGFNPDSYQEMGRRSSREAWIPAEAQDYAQEINPEEVVYDYQTGQPYIPPTSPSKYVSLEPFESPQLLLVQDLLHPFHAACAVAKSAGMLRNLVLMFGVEHSDDNDRTPLMYAVLGDKPSFAECLLECAAKPERYDLFGHTALHHATRLSHIRSANAILSNVPSNNILPLISQVDCDGLSVLHWAAQLESEGCLQLYLKHSSPGLVNGMDNLQQTPLYWAVSHRRARHTNLLLKNQAEATAVDGNQSPATHHAIRCHAVQCLKELLSYKVSLVDHKDRDGQTPLHVAGLEQCSECALVVLKAGGRKWAGLNAVDCLCQTALHCAAMAGAPTVVQLLLQRGADITIRDASGNTPQECASCYGNDKCQELLQAAEEARRSRNKGSSVCAVM